MPYSKIKNLLILILVLVNALLLCLVLPLRHERMEQQALEERKLADLFARSGVALAVGDLPEERTLYTLEFSPNPEAALPAANALLGSAVLAQADSTPYLSLYTASTGRVEFSRGGNLEARFYGRKSAGSVPEEVRSLMEGMGLETVSVSEPTRQSAGVYQVTAIQKLLDVPVFSSALVFTYRSGALTRLEGTAYFDTTGICRLDDVACASCADALVAFLGSRDALGWVGAAVQEVSQGYLHVETASAAVVRLVPGWRVSTDTGAFWVNGITREVSALE